MVNNESDFFDQSYDPFESVTVDCSDIDPDTHFFSSFDISKLCSFLNEAEFNSICDSVSSVLRQNQGPHASNSHRQIRCTKN